MGVYNTVIFSCPRCNNRIEVQSKADDGFNEFDSDDVPPATADDIEGQLAWCDRCHNGWMIVAVQPRRSVKMRLAGV